MEAEPTPAPPSESWLHAGLALQAPSALPTTLPPRPEHQSYLKSLGSVPRGLASFCGASAWCAALALRISGEEVVRWGEYFTYRGDYDSGRRETPELPQSHPKFRLGLTSQLRAILFHLVSGRVFVSVYTYAYF